MATVFTLEETAAFLKVHPSTIYRLLKKHKIPAFKVGSDWRFNQESVEKWIKDRETAESLGQGVDSAGMKG
jgi:excisionase family DNA binding protein